MNPKTLTLYAITDRTWLKEGESLKDAVEQAILGGATIVQLREKKITGAELEKLALEVFDVCKKYKIPFIVNDDVMLAKKIDADGVHVGADDMDVAQARQILGQNKIVGATAKTVEQALAAEKAGADYLGSGAIFGTTTKADAKPMSMELLNDITDSVTIPVVAIGGIDGNNVEKLAQANIAGVAVVSGIFAQPDLKKAALDLRCKLKGRSVIHCITNAVTVNDVANVVLAVGASPIMSHHPLEVEEVQNNADALLINLGAIESLDAMKTAYKTALEAGHPIVIDPVGVGGNSYRRKALFELLKLGIPTCIRGNFSEIKALLNDAATMRGLDDDLASQKENKADVVMSLAKKLGCIVVASGETDYVCDGRDGTCIEVSGGHKMQKLITGSGCMLSGIIAAMLSLSEEATAARVAFACSMAGQCALEAGENSNGTMTFRMNFIDNISRVWLHF